MTKKNISIFENKLISNKGNPFQNDYTGSWSMIAGGLSNLVEIESKSAPFVLSVNAIWGAGKTTFIDMWGQSLINSGKNVVKFDAWKHDYIQDPLGTFIAALSKQLLTINPSNKKFKKLEKKGWAVCKAFAKFGARALIERLKIDQSWQKLGEDISSGIADSEVDTATQMYDDTIFMLNDFKNSLREVSKNHTLFIFIDELDRCKPIFAIEMIEIIKHIVDVENICCILSTNIILLSRSIQNFYGYEKEEAIHYLERVIDISFALPLPDIKKFTLTKLKDIDAKYSIQSNILSQKIIEISCIHIKSLRKMEKYFNDIKVFLSCNAATSKEERVPDFYYPCIFAFLAYDRIDYKEGKNDFSSELSKNKKYEWLEKFFKCNTKEAISNTEKELFEYLKNTPDDAIFNELTFSIKNEVSKLYASDGNFQVHKYTNYLEFALRIMRLQSLENYGVDLSN